MMKLLLAPGAVPALAVMAEGGILQLVLGGVPLLAGLSNMIKVEAASGAAPSSARRLGALAVLVEEDAERLWQRLRLTNGEHDTLRSMAVGWRGLSPSIGEARARELLYRLRPGPFLDRILLAWARSPRSRARFRLAHARDAAAAPAGAGLSAEVEGVHRPRHRPRDRRSARRSGWPKKRGSRRISPPTSRRSPPSSSRRWTPCRRNRAFSTRIESPIHSARPRESGDPVLCKVLDARFRGHERSVVRFERKARWILLLYVARLADDAVQFSP